MNHDPRFPACSLRKGAGTPALLLLLFLGALALLAAAFLARPDRIPDEGVRPDRPSRVEAAVEMVLPAELPAPFPGLSGVRDAVEDAGGWWILDPRTHRIHRTGPRLEPRFEVGGRGEGPGEFRSAVALATRGDSLLVLDQDRLPVIQVIGPDGGLGPRTTLGTPECMTFTASGFAAEPSGRILLSGLCVRSALPVGVGPVVLAFHPDGSSERVFGAIGPPDPLDVAFRGVAVASGPGGSWAGEYRDPCLLPLLPPGTERTGGTGEGEGGGGALACLRPWVAVPFSVDDMARGVPGGVLPRELREATEGIEWLPVFDRLFHHPRGLVLRRLQGLESRSLVLVEPSGAWTTLDTGLPEAVFVGRTSYLVAWDSPEAVHPELRPLPPH